MQKDIVLITGNFNVLHPGHIRLFKFAKNFASKLVVGIISDKLASNAVDVSETLRQEAVEAIDIVDEAVLIASDLENFLSSYKPEFVVKGKEYENRENPELKIINVMAANFFSVRGR